MLTAELVYLKSQIPHGWEDRWERSKWPPALHSYFGQGRAFKRGSPRQGDQVSFHRNYSLQWLRGITKSSREVFQPLAEIHSLRVHIQNSLPSSSNPGHEWSRLWESACALERERRGFASVLYPYWWREQSLKSNQGGSRPGSRARVCKRRWPVGGIPPTTCFWSHKLRRAFTVFDAWKKLKE